MFYREKYLKYKSKYLTLKNHFGGTKEENNNFLLHGTSLFYINDIKLHGLTGRYNQEIYDIIKKNWPKIKYLARDPYVQFFLDRQKNIRNSGYVYLSFTGQSSVAKEYSDGARHFGEGPSRFLRTLKEYIYQNKEEITQDIKKDCDLLNKAYQYPGIILAIDKNDFCQTRNIKIENLNEWEHSLNFPIPPDKLYIRKNKNNYILLLSEEENNYIDKLNFDILEKKKKEKKEQEKNKKIKK